MNLPHAHVHSVVVPEQGLRLGDAVQCMCTCGSFKLGMIVLAVRSPNMREIGSKGGKTKGKTKSRGTSAYYQRIRAMRKPKTEV